MLYRNSGEWGWGLGWLVGAQNSLPLAALTKQQSFAAIGFLGTLFLSSIFSSEFAYIT